MTVRNTRANVQFSNDCKWGLLLLFIVPLVSLIILGDAAALTISELMYNPVASPYDPPVTGEALEYIEVYNEGPETDDLSGFAFVDGVIYEFPQGTLIPPRSFLLVASNPDALREYYSSLGVDLTEVPIYGPYEGFLDNRGETIELRVEGGGRLIRFGYNDGGQWPAGADGTGHSLELLSPFYDLGEPESWEISKVIGGTPGTAGRFTIPTFDPISNLPSIDWTKEGFDDSEWLTGTTPIGYRYPISTELTDMRYNYGSVYTRISFDLGDPQGIEALSLEVFYEDGFVAYLNGTEIERSYTVRGAPGIPPAFNAGCDNRSPQPTTYDAFDVSSFGDLLIPGRNWLAVHGINTTTSSSDFIISARLIGTWSGTPTVLVEDGAEWLYFKGTEEPVPEEGNGDDTYHHIPGTHEHPDIVINEFLAKTTVPDVGDWIELYNRGSEAVEIGGMYLSDDADELTRFQIPTGEMLDPGDHRLFTREELGFGLGSFGEKIFLTAADLTHVINAVNYAEQILAEVSYGRFPDGGEEWYFMPNPSPGGPNSVELEDSIVINEIMYHPITEDETDEYVELYNRGTQDVDLTGWRLSKSIDFYFPAGLILKSGEYLVVAKDADHIGAKYGIKNVVGNYSGVLANDGERVRLRDQYDNEVDSVRYYDGGTWPELADGEGSSLELIDPRDDNDVAAAWAASDESEKSSWLHFSYTSVETNWWTYPESEFHMFLQHRGECLVDALRLSQGASEYLDNGSFESGTSGWSIDPNYEEYASGRFRANAGNHIQSSVTSEESYEGSSCLHIVASGRGDTYCNRIERDTSSPLTVGGTYTMSGYARWLSGSKWLIVRTHGQGMARAVELPIPSRLGTPGKPNSRFASNRGPSISEVQHKPILPKPAETVTVTARVADIDGLSSVELFYAVEGTGAFSSTVMNETGEPGSGIYTGTIPGQSDGTLMAFYIQATDGLGVSNTFPADPDYRQCLYQVVGTPKRSNFFVYRVLLPSDTQQKLTTYPKMSNELLPCSFIYDDTEMYYNCWMRLRGSPFIRGATNPVYSKCAMRIRFSPDNPFHERREINLDTMEAGRNPPLQSERVAYWIFRKIGIPWGQIRFVRVLTNQNDQGLYGDPQKVDQDYASFWFPDDPSTVPHEDEGYLYKIDDWFEFNDSGGFNNRNADLRYWGMGDLEWWGEEKELYRWNYRIRSRDEEDNLQPIVNLMSKLDPQAIPSLPDYKTAVESVMDVTEVLKEIAVRHVVGDWDSWGYNRGKNNLLYWRPSDGRFVLIPWDIDFVLGSGDGPTTSLTSSSLYGFSRLYSAFGDVYERALWEIATGPLAPGAADDYMDRTFELLSQEGVGAQSPSGIKSYLAARHDFIAQLLDRPVAITTNNGQPLVTTNADLVLTGTAPYGAETMTLNGEVVVPEWTSSTSWALAGILTPGVNDLTIEFFDSEGQSLGSAQITITLNVFAIHTVISYSGGVFIQWHSTEGQTYDVFAGDTPLAYEIIASGLKAQGPDQFYVDPAAPAFRQRYYRVGTAKPQVEPGLSAAYYDGMNFGTLLLSRFDDTVYFNWGQGSPAPEVPVDYFSVRWTGLIIIENPGLYTFWTNSDDGVRLSVAGEQLISNWTDHSATWNFGSINLSEGVYPLTLEFYENGGDAVIQLEYEGPGIFRQMVPADVLGH